MKVTIDLKTARHQVEFISMIKYAVNRKRDQCQEVYEYDNAHDADLSVLVDIANQCNIEV